MVKTDVKALLSKERRGFEKVKETVRKCRKLSERLERSALDTEDFVDEGFLEDNPLLEGSWTVRGGYQTVVDIWVARRNEGRAVPVQPQPQELIAEDPPVQDPEVLW